MRLTRLIGLAIAFLGVFYGALGSGMPPAAFIDAATVIPIVGACVTGFVIAAGRDVRIALRGVRQQSSTDEAAVAVRAIRGGRMGVSAGAMLTGALAVPRWWGSLAGNTDLGSIAGGLSALTALALTLLWAVIVGHMALLPLQIAVGARAPRRAGDEAALVDDALDFWVLAAGFMITGLFAATTTAF